MCEHDKGGAVPETSQNENQTSGALNDAATAAAENYDWLIACDHGLNVEAMMKYRPYLAELELTDQQATDLLQIMWKIMGHFVDLGLKQDAMSLVLEAAEAYSQSTGKVDSPGCGQGHVDSGAAARRGLHGPGLGAGAGGRHVYCVAGGRVARLS